MKQILAIGGGALWDEDMKFPIEEYFIKMTHKKNPRVLFIPTAAADNPALVLRFYDVFKKFNCVCSYLSLFAPPADIRPLILNQDAIYVSGGNTRSMLALWREWCVDIYLREAYKNGIVLGGSSAGAICWFESGLSDYIPAELNPIKALGFLTGSFCPHYDSEKNRRPKYLENIKNEKLPAGFAAQDNTALHFVEGKVQHVLITQPGRTVYHVSKDRDDVVEQQV